VIRLVMTLNGERLGEFGIAKPRTTIGRRAHNDIVIDHLGVSGEHAVIVQAPQGLLVQDLQSTNGTYVNEQAIEQHLLQPGDVIGIGRYQLQVADGAPAEARDAAVDGSGRAASHLGAGADAGAQASTGVAARHAVVRVLDGAASGREVLLTKDRTTFGKPGVLVVAIDRQDGTHVLSRVEGQALVRVNGVPMPPAGVPLHDGDLIDLTGTRLQFACA
jgi:hypothetical protein